jgi:predicted HTH transcriptional regulator
LGTPAAEVRRLNDLIHDRVSPTPTIHPSIHEVDGRNVIRLDVDSGGGILHALFLEPNNPEYYVRRNGSTYLARPEEIAQIVERRLNQQPATGLRSLL